MDVSRAHKRVRLRADEQGLLLFQLAGQLYYYTVCHFGAKFSAYWWARVGALLHRLAHRVLYSVHAGFLFVDDWFWEIPKLAAPLQACLLVLFLDALGCPLSWHKLQLGQEVEWIGLRIFLRSGRVLLPDAKIERVLAFLVA